jgi:hypothetical protein
MNDQGSGMSDEPKAWTVAIADRLRARSQQHGLDEEITALVVAAFALGVAVAGGSPVPELEEWVWVDAWEWSDEQHAWFKRGGSEEGSGDALNDVRG